MIKKIKKSPIILFTFIAMLLATLYWGWFVTERFVSKAQVVLQTPDIAPPELSFSSMMSGAGATNTADLLYLREYLLSVDVLKKLDKNLNLREHFSQPNIDLFHRLDKDTEIEFFHEYYLSTVDVILDSYSNVLEVSVSAYSAEMANKIATDLLKLGEEHMNRMGQRLANEQLDFIQKQVDTLEDKLEQAQQILLKYQDEQGLISPAQSSESLFAIISELNAELIKLKAQKNALTTTMSRSSTEVKKLTSNIKALQDQIDFEKSKMTGGQGGSALNKLSAEYNALLLKAEFAQEIYSNALATLESTRVEAARKLKQVSVIQSPTMPEYASDPDRVYRILVSVLTILLLSILAGLMVAVVKDHNN